MKLIVRHAGETMEVEVERLGAGYSVRMLDKTIEVDLESANRLLRSIRFEDGRQFLIGHHTEGSDHHISFGDKTVIVEVFDPLSLKRKRREDEEADSGTILALMPGRVVRILVEEGAAVEKGQGLLILEAMKMENEITAPKSGTVTKIHVRSGDTVEGGAELLLVD